MTVNGWIQIAIYFAVLTALVVPLGRYMARVFEGERTFLSPVLRPVEVFLYRVSGVDETREQHWITYTVAMLLFNAAGFLLRLRHPAAAGRAAAQSGGHVGRPGRPRLQHGRQLRHQHQLAELRRREHAELSHARWSALTTQNFVSAATGIALLIALIRAFARASANTVGNFWVDLTRCDALRAAAAVDRRRAVPRLAGRAAEPRRLCRRDHARRRQADA